MTFQTVKFQICFLCLSVALLTGCQTAADLDTATAFFNDVAFRSAINGDPVRGLAIAGNDYRSRTLRRWRSPIRYHVENPPGPAALAKIEEVFAFARTAGIVAEPAVAKQDNNLLIRFHQDGRFLIRLMEHVRCYARTWASDGEITRAEIHIDLQGNDHVAHCIVHELLHGFGLVHAQNLPSAVNYQMRLDALSVWDRLALRVLYDRRLNANMTRREALPLARGVIGEYLKTMKRDGA